MSYSILGNQCQIHTHALTSNAKYIHPNNSVYNKSFTPMLYYPGHINAHGLHADKLFESAQRPESVKAFDINDDGNDITDNHISSHKSGTASCKTCGQ